MKLTEDPTQIPQFLQVLTKRDSIILKSRTTLSGIVTSFNSSSSCDRQCNVSPPVFCPSSENSEVHKYVFWALYELQNCCATPPNQRFATWKASVWVSWSLFSFLKVRLCNLGEGGYRFMAEWSSSVVLQHCALSSSSTILSQSGGHCPTLSTHSP